MINISWQISFHPTRVPRKVPCRALQRSSLWSTGGHFWRGLAGPEGLGLKRLYLTAGVPSSPPFLACKCFRFPSATSTLNSICFGIKSVINCGAKQGRKSMWQCTHLFLEITSCGYISCTNENFDVNLSRDTAMVAHKGCICTEVHEGCVMNIFS